MDCRKRTYLEAAAAGRRNRAGRWTGSRTRQRTAQFGSRLPLFGKNEKKMRKQKKKGRRFPPTTDQFDGRQVVGIHLGAGLRRRRSGGRGTGGGGFAVFLLGGANHFCKIRIFFSTLPSHAATIQQGDLRSEEQTSTLTYSSKPP